MVVTQDFITPGVAASRAGNPLTSIVAGGGADIDRADRGCQSGGIDRPRGGHRWPGRRRSERDALSGSSTTGDHGVTVAATGLVLGNRGSGIEIGGAKPWSSTTARSAPGSLVYAPTANGHVQNFGLIRSGNSNAGSTFGVVVNGGNARVENFGTIPTSTQVGAGVNLATIGIGALGSRVENHGLIPGFAESVKGSAPGDLLITAGVLVGLADLAGGHDFYDGTGGSATNLLGHGGRGGR